MPTLTYIGPNGSRPTDGGRLTAELLGRLRQRFDAVTELDFSCGAADIEALLADPPTHLLLVGTPPQLGSLLSGRLSGLRSGGTLTFGYAFVEDSFLPAPLAHLPGWFDFFVTSSNIGAAVYRDAIAALPSVNKALFRAADGIRAIRPGVDSKTFRPQSSYHFDFDRSELRGSLFGGQVVDSDLLVFVPGPYADLSDYPEAMATVRQLADKIGRPVRAYFHTESDPDLHLLAAGNELRDPIFADKLLAGGLVSDQLLCYLYNAADLVLSCKCADGWPFGLVEAMASGTLVAAPAENCSLEVIDEQRGIELPTVRFDQRCGRPVRHTDPTGNAQVIVAAYSDQSFKEIRERGVGWARMDGANSWDACAASWAALMGR